MRLRTTKRDVKSACLAAIAGVALAGLTASCGDSGGPTSPSGNGSLRLLLTDDPIDEVDEVNIYFTGVRAKPVGDRPQELTLQLQENPIDLLTLDDQVVGFAAGAVTPGEFEFVHIDIDEGRSNIVVDGVEKRLRVPSEQIKILGGFTVDENRVTSLVLDFDARASLVQLGNGEWLLKPVIIVSDTGEGDDN